MDDVETLQNSASSYYSVLYIGHYSDTEGESFPVNVVLDLNGHTLTDTSTNNRMFGVYAGSSLVITNGSINADGKYISTGGLIFTSGACDITLDAVNVSANSGCKGGASTYGNIANINADGSLTVVNSKIKVYETEYTSGFNTNPAQNGGMFSVSGAVPVTFTNSDFIGGTAASLVGQFYVTAGATVNVTGCTFTDGTATRPFPRKQF